MVSVKWGGGCVVSWRGSRRGRGGGGGGSRYNDRKFFFIWFLGEVIRVFKFLGISFFIYIFGMFVFSVLVIFSNVGCILEVYRV